MADHNEIVFEHSAEVGAGRSTPPRLADRLGFPGRSRRLMSYSWHE
jgi:hypothetical protein